MTRSIVLFLIFLCTSSYAQPQWKFHLAFEDAVGAKDTVWLIWDVNATFSVDNQFNEQAQNINYSIFNTFIGNANGDTTKTQAFPYSTYSNNTTVYSINCQFPLTISWDTALFHTPTLPQPVGAAYMDNGYFFGINNCPSCQHFNMLTDNHVTIDLNLFPYFFPVSVNISRGAPVGIMENNLSKHYVSVFPNPAKDMVSLKATEIKECVLTDNTGKIMLKKIFYDGFDYILHVNDVPSGFYNLKITNQKNETYYEKLVIAK